MSFALVARCDPGGLSSITAEVFRHLCPAKTLLLDAHRGPCNDRLYETDESRQQLLYSSFDGALPGDYADWIGSGVDALFSAETFYDEKVIRAAKANGVRTVMLAMPELAPWATTSPDRARVLKPDVLVVPTAWRIETLPGAGILPVPVARDRLRPTLRREVAHLYHVTGAAMLDRNGTDLFLRALPLMEHDVRVTIRSERPITVPPCRHDVIVTQERTANYWEAYPPEIDLLVMPRRYGGLCLPVQEAASLGVPSLVLDADPYAGEPFTFTVPTTRSTTANMKGAALGCENPVRVWDASPADLARTLDRLVNSPHLTGASAAANAWAETHAWDSLLGMTWCEMLMAECGSMAA